MDARARQKTRVEAVRSPLTLDDLVADMVWPRLLRAGSLALHPGRLGIAFFMLIILALVVALLTWVESQLGWAGNPTKQAHLAELCAELSPLRWVFALPGTHPAAAGDAIVDAFLALPRAAAEAHPLVVPLSAIAGVLLWAVAGGAISRGAAVEIATGEAPTWPQAVAFATGRWRSLAGAVAGPVLLVWAIALVMAVAGLVLFRFPVVNWVGGLLYGVFLLGGLVAALVMVAYLVGHWMLVPAVACEGTDAIDAIQRSYAYVFGRPGRLVLYLVTLGVQALIVGWVVWMLSSTLIGFTEKAGGFWAGRDGWVMLHEGTAAALSSDEAAQRVVDEASKPREGETTPHVRNQTFEVGARFIKFWTLVPMLLVWSFGVSFVFCGSTLLYLAMRRATDGQEMTDLWMPQRQADTGEGAPPAPPPPGAEQAPDEVPDAE